METRRKSFGEAEMVVDVDADVKILGGGCRLSLSINHITYLPTYPW